ncbi:MAG: spore cortex biosynthesis protein YabQ [Lachnospiraceae bacterium]|nr:spore cortex biosynthesis protein YabQ [Lachnospiraceae bacterium]
MSRQIVEEFTFLWYSVCMGIVITFFYDMIRLFRELIPHKKWMVSAEDTLFWIITCAAQFMLLYKVNNGILRWYSIAGAFLGMILYKKTIGLYMVVFLSKLIRKTLHIVLRIFMYVFSPIRWIVRKAKPVFMRIAQNFRSRQKNAKNKLTAQVGKVKISLCKHNNPKDGEVEL